MRQILISIILACFVFSITAQAQIANSDLLKQLIDLPSPSPVLEKEPIEKINRSNKLPLDFFAKNKIPKDDAPIADVFEFWRTIAKASYYGQSKLPTISSTIALRILDFIQPNPEILPSLLNILPNNNQSVAGKVRTTFELIKTSENVSISSREWIRNWLKYNDQFYLEELYEDALQAKDDPNYKIVHNESYLSAFVRNDWERGESLLLRLEKDLSNPRTAIYAKTLLYENALKTNESDKIEEYRNKLKADVKNREFTYIKRKIALDGLTRNKKWEGLDDWYLSLFDDEMFAEHRVLNSYGLKDPDKWIPILAALIGNENQVIHQNAVNILAMYNLDKARIDALKPLIPWLSDPNWANNDSDYRLRLIQSLDRVDLPESVPGLIWVVENDTDEFNRSYAAESLMKYKDSRAIPTLRVALNEESDFLHRRRIIKGLIASGGISEKEQLAALEAFIIEFNTPVGNKRINAARTLDTNIKPLPIQISIGQYIGNMDEPSKLLRSLLIERRKALKDSNPLLVEVYSNILTRWQGIEVNQELIRHIAEEKANANIIVGALAKREELRETVPSELNSLLGKKGFKGGIAACVLEDNNKMHKAFSEGDLEKKITILACSRLLRTALPLEEVALLVNSENKLLALAAERYLESENSLESRQVLYSKYPDKALILGATFGFHTPARRSIPTLAKLFLSVNQSYLSIHTRQLQKLEDSLRDELLENKELEEIYGFFNVKQNQKHIIRTYSNGENSLTIIDDKSPSRVRKFYEKELNTLRDFVHKNKIEQLPPITKHCYECPEKEFLYASRKGGYRWYINASANEQLGLTNSSFEKLRELENIFERFENSKISR